MTKLSINKFFWISLTSIFSHLVNCICQDTVYIKADGVAFSTLKDHSSWSTATFEIQKAIDNLSQLGGGTIWIAAGCYKPTSSSNRNVFFHVKNNIRIYGGFSGNENTLKDRIQIDRNGNGKIEPWEFLNETIFSGDIGIINVASDNSMMIFYGDRTENNEINGITIVNCNNTKTTNNNGIINRCSLTQCSLINNIGKSMISDSTKYKQCYFERNNFSAYMLNRCNLDSCDVKKNSFVSLSCFSKFSYCQIDSNSCQNDFFSSLSVVNYSTISNNSINGYLADYSAEVNSCKIINNKVGYQSNSKFTSCLLANNLFGSFDGRYYSCSIVRNKFNSSFGPQNISNSIFWGNTGSFIYSLSKFVNSAVQGKYIAAGNIALSDTNARGPRFNLPSDSIGYMITQIGRSHVLNANWALTDSSMCIDASLAEYFSLLPFKDAYGKTRIKGKRLDLGGIEYQSTDYVGITAGYGNIVYVTETGAGNMNGNSWSNATNNLQLALYYANLNSPCQVWIAKGTYAPVTSTNRDIYFKVQHGVRLYGGFNGNENSLDNRIRYDENANGVIEPWEFVNKTILSANIGNKRDSLDNSVTLLIGADYYPYTEIFQRPDTTSIIDGITFMDCYNSSSFDAVIEVCNLQNCIITSNNFYGGDGSIVSFSNLRNCLIARNSPNDIRNFQSYPTGKALFYAVAHNCTIKENLGGGAWNSKLYNCNIQSNSERGIIDTYAEKCDIINNHKGGGENSTLINCRIINNEAVLGGGVYKSNCTNCIFSNNLASRGGAAYNSNIYNCSIVNNEATDDGGGSYDCVQANSIFWQNKQKVNNYSSEIAGIAHEFACAAKKKYLVDYDIIELNSIGPLFFELPDFVGHTKDEKQLQKILQADFSLQKGSLCINKGINSNYSGPALDVYSRNRINDTIIDIGAAEFNRFIPDYTIDFRQEKTNQIIPNYVVYNNKPIFDGNEKKGNNQSLDLKPQNAISLIYFLMYNEDNTKLYIDSLIVPKRNEAPLLSINYLDESLKADNCLLEWNISGVYQPMISYSITNIISETNIKTVYVREQASDTSFASKSSEVSVKLSPGIPNARIDYTNEEIVGLHGNEISVFSKDTIPITLTNFDISNMIPEFGQQPNVLQLKVPSSDTTFASRTQELKIIARPAPPTEGLIDDKLNTFSWTWSKDKFTNYYDYEYAIDNLNNWSLCNQFPIIIGDIDLPAGQLYLRVAASDQPYKEHFKSNSLLSDQAFTKQMVAVSELHSAKVSVYPSATKSSLSILNVEDFDLFLYNSQGCLIKMNKNCSKGVNILDLSDHPSGIYYILILNQSNEIKEFKVIRQ